MLKTRMKITSTNPVQLLAFLALIARRPVAQTTIEIGCPYWCDILEQPTQETCSTWMTCSECSFCYCDPSSCLESPEPWETKCGLDVCRSCQECFSHLPCSSWCPNRHEPWSTKCTWADCSSCVECFTSQVLSSTATVVPTLDPTTQATPSPTTDAPVTATPTMAPVEALPGPPIPHATPKRPNILLILADDIGTGDVPGYWENENTGLVDMPNMHELANKGTLFTDAHATPVCATSRYVLLSGNYQHRGRSNGGTWMLGQPSQFLDDQQSIAQVLRDGGGYDTLMVGKWHLGGLIPASDDQTSTTSDILLNPKNNWTKPLVQGPQTVGFDTSYITDKGIQSTPYSFFEDGFLTTAREDVHFWNIGTYDMPFGQSEIISEGYGDVSWDSTAYNMILVNKTNDFLDDHFANRSDDPFFAYVALGAAHMPHTPPDSYIDGESVAGETPTAFLDMLKEVDLVVGSLVESIESRGIAKDTIIIFTSDNGGLSNNDTHSESFGHYTQGPLHGHKGSISEGGHRIPFIMRYDGVFPAGEERTEVIGINDIFATLCDIAGVDIPSGAALDSVSFKDYIVSNDSTAGLREYLGIWKDTREGEPRSWSIRYNNFKLNYYYRNNVTTLHDLDTDIGEASNLAWDAEYEGLIQTMRDEIYRLRPPS